jgi:methenyltetrahydrofolate cyclohydrolase
LTSADATVAELLEQLAEATPSPGGGTAAGLVGAVAAALTEMVAAFALARATEGQDSLATLRGHAGALRARLLRLAEADAHAYQPVLDALALAHDDERRAATLRAALSAAAEVPLEIAAASAEVAELAATIMQTSGNGLLLGDASAALTFAEAAVGAAARLVELNLQATPKDQRLQQAATAAHRAALLRSNRALR